MGFIFSQVPRTPQEARTNFQILHFKHCDQNHHENLQKFEEYMKCIK